MSNGSSGLDAAEVTSSQTSVADAANEPTPVMDNEHRGVGQGDGGVGERKRPPLPQNTHTPAFDHLGFNWAESKPALNGWVGGFTPNMDFSDRERVLIEAAWYAALLWQRGYSR